MSWKRTSLWVSKANERAWILSDIMCGTSNSEELLVLAAITYNIRTSGENFSAWLSKQYSSCPEEYVELRFLNKLFFHRSLDLAVKKFGRCLKSFTSFVKTTFQWSWGKLQEFCWKKYRSNYKFRKLGKFFSTGFQNRCLRAAQM